MTKSTNQPTPEGRAGMTQGSARQQARGALMKTPLVFSGMPAPKSLAIIRGEGSAFGSRESTPPEPVRGISASDPFGPGGSVYQLLAETHDLVGDTYVRKAGGGLSIGDALHGVREMYEKYVSFRSEHEAVFLALWTAHTYVWEQADRTPYARITSAEKQSGKSRLLEVAATLVNRPKQTASISPAVMYRIIEDRKPTLLIDEIDQMFASKTLSESMTMLLGILNAGFSRGGVVDRYNMKTNEAEEFSVFGPKLIAGIGQLPDTLTSRSVEILLERARADEPVARWRQREGPLEAAPLVASLTGWAQAVQLGMEPEVMPEGMTDREDDMWEPLLVIAESVGGEWPELARAAAVGLSNSKGSSDLPSVSLQLIEDLRGAWAEGVPGLPTTDLIKRIYAIEESPWATWQGRGFNAHDLSLFLRRYGIKSAQLRVGATRVQGYKWADLYEKAWSRYLPPLEQTKGGGADVEQTEKLNGDSANLVLSALSAVNIGNSSTSSFDTGNPAHAIPRNGQTEQTEQTKGESGCLTPENCQRYTQGAHGLWCPDWTSKAAP